MHIHRYSHSDVNTPPFRNTHFYISNNCKKMKTKDSVENKRDTELHKRMLSQQKILMTQIVTTER